jgi:hypothetical protein
MRCQPCVSPVIEKLELKNQDLIIVPRSMDVGNSAPFRKYFKAETDFEILRKVHVKRHLSI